MNLTQLTLAATTALAASSAGAADAAAALDPLQLQTQVHEQVRTAAHSGAPNSGISEEQLRLREQQRLRDMLRLHQRQHDGKAEAERHSHYGQGYESRGVGHMDRPSSGAFPHAPAGGRR